MFSLSSISPHMTKSWTAAWPDLMLLHLARNGNSHAVSRPPAIYFHSEKMQSWKHLMWFSHLLSRAGLGHRAGAYRRGVGRDVSVGARSRRSASADRTEPGCTLGMVRNHCHHPEDGTFTSQNQIKTLMWGLQDGFYSPWHLLFPRSQCLKLATSIKGNAVSDCGLKFQMTRLVSNSARSEFVL